MYNRLMKVLFFDIDGTLAIRKKIVPSALEALKKLKEKGYKTFICSGRPPFYVKEMFEDLVSGYICCNGRYIVYEGEKLFGLSFSSEELKEYIKLIDSKKAGALFVSDDETYAYNMDENFLEFCTKQYREDRVIPFNSQQNIYTFDLFFKCSFDEISETFKDKLVLNNHGDHGSCDCSTISFNKGSAIEYVLNYFHIAKEDAYAFGDGFNDICMFDKVGNAVAMGNSVEKLKEKASYITDHINNDGIVKALEYYGLL